MGSFSKNCMTPYTDFPLTYHEYISMLINIYILFFFLNNIKFLTDSRFIAKRAQEFLCTLHPASPDANVLHNHAISAKTENLTSVKYY